MSKLFSLRLQDLLKSTIIFMIASILQAFHSILSQNQLPSMEQSREIVAIAFTTGVSYLVKNFFTNSKGKFLSKE